MLGESDDGLIDARTGEGLKVETEHEFTLVLDGISELASSIVDALFEAGCDDATISKQGGLVLMDFDRTAPTMTEAIVSAIQDVRKANIGATVLRVEECQQRNHMTREEAEREARGTAAVNSALSLAAVVKFDPQLYKSVLPLINPAASA
jgi:hypothetical protein